MSFAWKSETVMFSQRLKGNEEIVSHSSEKQMEWYPDLIISQPILLESTYI